MADEEQADTETCDFIEKHEQLLIKGDELQKLSVIGSLPELLSIDKNGTITRLMPKIQQELPNASPEFSLAASKMFNMLINMDVPYNLIPQVIQGIDNKNAIIVNAWMETLLAVIPVLKESLIKQDILKCAISKSQLSKAPYYRVSSCRILGKISVHQSMSAFDVKRDILPLVQSLCQDCFHEVRAAMCKEIPNVANGLHNLGNSVVKANLMPLLVELSSDDNVFVRSVAIDSVVMTIPYLCTDTIKGTVIPLLKKLCTKSVSEGDTTYTAMANNYRKLIMNILPQLSQIDAIWFLDYYVHIARKGYSLVVELDSDPSVSMLCRENCAKALPVVAAMVMAEIPDEIVIKWYQTFKDLAGDPCYIVRKAVASCFDETVKILGRASNMTVLEFCRFLREDDEEVLQVIVPKISVVLKLFHGIGVISREAPIHYTIEVGRALVKCFTQVFKSFNWRMKECLLVQFETLPMVFPSDIIHAQYTQLVLNATLRGKAKPVRSQASKTLLVFLKYNLKENQRKWILESINNQLCSSNCCYTRQVYVQLCVHAMNIFSKSYFKENFYLPLLTLTDDPISIVRLSVIKITPALKQMLTLPQDKALQLKLENGLSKLEMVESDIDVIRTLRAKLKDMRVISVIKADMLQEERRRIEEEMKIAKGKFPVKASTIPVKSTKSDPILPPEVSVKSPKYTKKPPITSSPSERNFLARDLYIDVGDFFPKHLPSTKRRDESIPWKPQKYAKTVVKSSNDDIIISLDNLNIESLTEQDLQTLETTTNITDDVKVNIQKISKNNELKKVSKRYSYHESDDKEKTKNENSVKRRSLNMSVFGGSKIPVSAKSSRRLSLCEKVKSASDQNLTIGSNLIQKATSLPKLTKNMIFKKPQIETDDTFSNTFPSFLEESQSLQVVNTEGNSAPTPSSSSSIIRKASSLPVYIAR